MLRREWKPSGGCRGLCRLHLHVHGFWRDLDPARVSQAVVWCRIILRRDQAGCWVYFGQIYTSTNSGVTWTPRESNRYWTAVASSSDGTQLVAVEGSGQLYTGGQIYTSTYSGVTWTPHESARNWYRGLASSSDGTQLVAAVYGGQIYTADPTTFEVQSTTVGTAGWISGGQYDAVELQYIGNNTFTVLSNEGYLVVQ